MPLTMDDFYDRGDGYFLRELGTNGDGFRSFEIVREDGFSFGATPEPYIEEVIEQDRANPKPATTYTLRDIIEAPAEPTPPPPGDVPAEDDAAAREVPEDGEATEVNVENGEALASDGRGTGKRSTGK